MPKRTTGSLPNGRKRSAGSPAAKGLSYGFHDIVMAETADGQTEDERWQDEFDRRSRDARSGSHHPLLDELLRRMPPLHGRLEADVQLFAERLAERLKSHGPEAARLADLSLALVSAPAPACFVELAAALEALWRSLPDYGATWLADAAARCDYYAAAASSQMAAFRTAGRAMVHAMDDNVPHVAQLASLEAAFGWLMQAGRDLPDVVDWLGPERGGSACPRSAELGSV